MILVKGRRELKFAFLFSLIYTVNRVKINVFARTAQRTVRINKFMFKLFENLFGKEAEIKIELPMDKMALALRETALEDRRNYHWLSKRLNDFLFNEKESL